MIRILSFFWILLSTFALNASINLTLDYASFNIIGAKPYVELYLSVNGNSILYANTEEDLYQANLEITYLIERDSQVVAFEKLYLFAGSATINSK